MNIIYFGSAGPLSCEPLRALLSSGCKVAAIAVDSLHEYNLFISDIPTINATAESIESLALLNDIPLIKLTNNLSENSSEICAYQPDIILVSCYGRRLPDDILSIPKIGCFNIHPSLLPAYRGPAPVFWQFREGEPEFGVTLHRMSSRYDSGNIISQKKITIPDGVSKRQANSLLAHGAAELLKQALPVLQRGQFTEMPQNEDAASYQGFPTQDDYRVSIQWTAKRMYNFMCATWQPSIAFSCEVDGRIVRLLQAHSYQDETNQEIQGKRYSIKDHQITLACQQGIIRCQFAE